MRSFILTLMICLAVSLQIEQLELNHTIKQPRVYQQKVPIQYGQKLVHESFVKLLGDVNFQLNSYLYVKDGKLDDPYNTSAYAGFSSHCRIYKTDFKIQEQITHQYDSALDDTLVVQYGIVEEDGEIGAIYLAQENDQVTVLNMYVDKKYAKQQTELFQFDDVKISVSNSYNFTVQTDPKQKINLFKNTQGKIFLVTKNKLLQFDDYQNKQWPIEGYNDNGFVVEAGAMDDNEQTENTRFYTQTNKGIFIYEFVTDNKVNLVANYTQFNNSNLRASYYDDDVFYITALHKLYVLDLNQNEDKLYFLPVNGSCEKVQKFQTTLHLSCEFEKLQYVAQFLVVNNQISINRYYASEDMQGRAVARRIGMGKLAIVTDNDIRLTGYAWNRNTLLVNGVLQPEYVFNVRYGLDLAPLQMITSSTQMAVVVFTPGQLEILKIKQTPPELYCEYPSDEPGAVYTVLMVFNTSRCSYVENQEDLLYGNIQTVCEVYVPFVIETKQMQMEVKHANFIQIVLIMVLLSVFVLILACFIKFNKRLSGKFEQVQRALERAQGGNKKSDI